MRAKRGGLVLEAAARRAIERHAARAYPEECCGALAGIVRDGEKRVRIAIPVENARRDAARVRYRIEGEEVRRAEEEAARSGVEIVGWYHSHPDAPAVPSATDRDDATWPFYSYAIISVLDGAAAELRSWTLTEDRSAMEEEPVHDDAGGDVRDSDQGAPRRSPAGPGER